MKTLAELAAIREKMQSKVVIREGNASTNEKVTITQTGCIGICQYEPVVEIFEEGKEKVTYVKLTAEKAAEIVKKHLKGGQVVAEYTIGAYKKD